ncbi:unnamed protein product [Eruca vesicaria subsp. sativa]|uniref:F-box domain-containing protein n=1 Tax=Eruca vesicaria subsp. sativa TaxID=29727 RepID=A0ABC8IW38_ERUVS|nr:unnamed protein product [Eruca vesicaria subsp. sativa]
MDLSSNRQRRSQAQEIHIPTELVTEILKRLPAKTLMRFKCVSKLWESLIRSKYFSNQFLTVSSQKCLYMCLSDINEDDPKSVILSLVPNATNPSTFVVDHDVTIPWLGSYNLHNLCGFMWSSDSKIPRIYNPATRQLVTLPATSPCSQGYNTFYYFGHDPVNDQYKLICLNSSYTYIRIYRKPEGNIRYCLIGGGPPPSTLKRGRRILKRWVLVLKPGASWKEMDPTYNHMPISRPGLSINGRIYYMANYVVVSFNIRSEKFKTISAPSVHGGLKNKKVSLIEYGGRLALFDHTHLKHKGKVALWVLENTRKEKWSKKTLVLQPSHLNLVDKTNFEVKGTTQSGKVLLIPSDLRSPFYILCYDLQNNDMTKIDINGLPDHWFDKKAAKRCFSLMFMDQSESILYLGDLN